MECHVGNKHEGVRYPCIFGTSEYAATHASILKVHLKNKHKGVR